MVKITLRRLPAATIIETMVAMTILLVMFGMAIGLLVQVSVAGNSEKKIKAEQLLNEFAVMTRQEKQYEDTEITKDDYLLKRAVGAYGGKAGLVEVEYSIYDVNKKKLLERKELLIHD